MIVIKRRSTGEVLIRQPGRSLRMRNFHQADLRDADFTGADLRDVGFARADLTGAHLAGACLWQAELTHAVLIGADLREADLTSADLEGACLDDADLTGAIYNRRTRWPHLFRPDRRGAIRDESHRPPPRPAIPVGFDPQSSAETLTPCWLEAGPLAADAPPIDVSEAGDRHKMGGLPDWIQGDDTPLCRHCGQEMVFIAQLDSPDDSHSFGDVGLIYVFYCYMCLEPAAVMQCF